MSTDYIDISDSIGGSVVNATVKPAEDGDFIFKIQFASTGNNQGTPIMWGELTGPDGEFSKSANKTAWNDGSTGLREVFRKTFHLKGGKTYDFKAQGQNENASANEIKLLISRM